MQEANEVAEQRQKSGMGAFLAIGVLAIAGLFFLRRDNGGDPDPDPTPVPTTEVILLGTVGQVSVSQTRRRHAGMARHLVLKGPGDGIVVRVNGEMEATNQTGQPIIWPWRLRVRFGHNTLFGWRTPDQLGFPENGEEFITFSPFSGSLTFSRLTSFIAPRDNNQEWDVRIDIQAAKHDGAGNPVTGEWDTIAQGEHAGAVRTVDFGANRTGNVGTVTVSKRDRLGRVARR